jgi:hypothetical protein
MCSFSGKLAGVLLEHNHYGNHLKSDGSVSDIDLAKRNMEYASDQLKGYWTKDNYCGKPVYYSYVGPEEIAGVNTRFEWLNLAREEIRYH